MNFDQFQEFINMLNPIPRIPARISLDSRFLAQKQVICFSPLRSFRCILPVDRPDPPVKSSSFTSSSTSSFSTSCSSSFFCSSSPSYFLLFFLFFSSFQVACAFFFSCCQHRFLASSSHKCSQWSDRSKVYALSRDEGLPFSSIWREIHPTRKVPANAVWLCAAICIIAGLPILKANVVFTAIISICTIGWVGSYGVPIFARLVMDEKNFNPGPFYLGKYSRPVCLVALLWIGYTCSVFLLPTLYPIEWKSFNYAPVAMGVSLAAIMLWWMLDARRWFKGPVRNIGVQNGKD